MGNFFQALSQTREKVAKVFKILSKNRAVSDSIDELEQLQLSSDMGFEIVESILNVVKNNKDEDLFNVLENLLSNEKKLIDLGEKAKERAINSFTWEKVARKYIHAIKNNN